MSAEETLSVSALQMAAHVLDVRYRTTKQGLERDKQFPKAFLRDRKSPAVQSDTQCRECSQNVAHGAGETAP